MIQNNNTMIQIYHNPRCTKSRQGLAYLQERELVYEEIRYLDAGLTIEELQSILEKLDKTPLELIRKNEAVWKSDFKNKTLSDQEILEAMVNYPKLMERPVIINGNKAVIGRPTEVIATIL